MAVYSMTGFASGQVEPQDNAEQLTLGFEIRSVNSRFLDLVFKLPEALKSVESQFRQMLVDELSRGKIEVRVFVRQSRPIAGSVVDSAAIQHLLNQQEMVLAWMPQARALSVAEVIELQARMKGSDGAEDAIEWSDAAAKAFGQCIAQLKAARATEGARLKAVLDDKIEALRDAVHKAGPLIPAAVEQHKAKFMERWSEMLASSKDTVSLDLQAMEQRAIAELTAYAIRIDVAEELARLQAHLDEITSLLKKGGAIGKRLDFLIQELHREANTLGSKSASLELSRISMEMKVLVEQMREQVQNIE
ncbi:YicC family protein [Lampropedia aestuarii]|uniref:YicC family protein n=1 Tax=Lampropedia aestuarii TaxID=2562762 RepID=A0A4S5BU82_9BURK|nr:YicC/YloC family endoribonuclease [Lampropedia aestuarii]THJ36494.1 YicC family protein [Lampropedia aestuarii]